MQMGVFFLLGLLSFPSALKYIKVSGDIFRDMTIHDFDTARFFLGEIKEVYNFKMYSLNTHLAISES